MFFFFFFFFKQKTAYEIYQCDWSSDVCSSDLGRLKEALIIGSAESPDPVLQRVQALEREGVVKDVVVLESFPVQIHLKASQDVIDELNNIPRMKGNLR